MPATPAAAPELPPEQLKRIEDALYRAVLGRVLRAVAIGALLALGVVALAGWLSWSLIRREVIGDAVAELQLDPGFRSDLLAGLGLDSAGLTQLLDSLQTVALERAGGLGPGTDETELRRLLEQMMGGDTTSTRGGPARRLIPPRH